MPAWGWSPGRRGSHVTELGGGPEGTDPLLGSLCPVSRLLFLSLWPWHLCGWLCSASRVSSSRTAPPGRVQWSPSAWTQVSSSVPSRAAHLAQPLELSCLINVGFNGMDVIICLLIIIQIVIVATIYWKLVCKELSLALILFLILMLIQQR